MNTHDKYELPPLPEPGEALSKWAYNESDMQDYAREAIQADRKQRHLKEKAQLEQEWCELKDMQAQYEADRKRHSEEIQAHLKHILNLQDLVSGLTEKLQQSRGNIVNNASASSEPVALGGQPFRAQPAEPVKHPSYDHDCCQGHKAESDCKCARYDAAAPVAAQAQSYSLNLDPAGIRALTADAITGAIAFGHQGVNPPPDSDHWLAPFWEIGRESATNAQQPVSGADGLDAAVDKAWSRFQAAIAPTDDELEEFAGRYADERGCIHDDTHAEMARALLDEFATRHRYASPGDTQPQPSGNSGELPDAVAWMTHHDEPMVFLSASECAHYCDEGEVPIPLVVGLQVEDYAAASVRAALAAQASGQEERPGITNPLTPYGSLVRALRLVADTTLMEMSEDTGYTPAFLSSVEIGRESASDALLTNTRNFFVAKGVNIPADVLERAARAAAKGEASP